MRGYKLILVLLCAIGVLAVAFVKWRAATPAPRTAGAEYATVFKIEGFGGNTVGGAGGTLYTVTNLNDSGPCSLRDFLNRPGPRIIKFAVSGWITLNSRVALDNPYITIDGSDAPNGGIGIRGDGIDIGAHDVIVRHIRFRSDTWATDDPVQINGHDYDLPTPKIPYNVVFDHCSITAGVDGNLDIGFGAHDITLQYCLIAENYSSGAILQKYKNTTRITYHHNLFANNFSNRNPTIHSGDTDHVNNVIYTNFTNAPRGFENMTRVYPEGPGSVENTETTIATRVNYVGDYFKAGPNEDISSNAREIYLHGGQAGSSISSVYLSGNISPQRPNNSLQETALVLQADNVPLTILGSRHNFPQVTTTDAFTAYNEVLANVGATLPCRDAVDRRIVDYVRNGTGSFPWDNRDSMHPDQTGGWPVLTQPCAGAR